MQQIKIVRGTYGHRPAGTHRIRPVMAGNTVSVPDAEAERLVSIGVAEIVPLAAEPVNKIVATSQNGQTEGEPGMGMDAEMRGGEANAGSGAASIPDLERLKTLTNAKLRELAESMGIPTAKLKNKNELIQAITAIQSLPIPEDESVDDGEHPPELCAEAPVV